MRPKLSFLTDTDVDRIIDAALTVLEKVGLHIGSARVTDLVAAFDGAAVDGERVRMSRDLVERALENVPAEVRLYPQDDGDPVVLAGDEVNYVAGTTVPYIYDPTVEGLRQPTSIDIVNHAKVLNHCKHIDLQAGSFVANDVPKPITGAYRYYLGLLFSPKPMFSGAFGISDIQVIWDLLCAMAGGEKALVDRPLSLMCVNPSSPLGLTEVVAEMTMFTAERNYPTVFIPIPLAGGTSPVTLAGTLTQHTAENLGALVVCQSVRPGAPVVFGGGPSVMDQLKGTACQASPESIMMGAASAQIAKRLGIPSSTNTGRADSKVVDYQAGEESGAALITMALAGINLIRGPGMLEFANVVSTEKMLIDNEICGIAKSMVRPISTDDDALAVDLILERGVKTEGFMSARHTLRWFRSEVYMPSPLIDRGSRREFEEGGGKDAFQRARARVDEILAQDQPREVDEDRVREAVGIMTAYAKKHGMDELPVTGVY